MKIEGRTIILSTPEELIPLITEAIRAAGYGQTPDDSGGPAKKLLAPKDVEKYIIWPLPRTISPWYTTLIPFLSASSTCQEKSCLSSLRKKK